MSGEIVMMARCEYVRPIFHVRGFLGTVQCVPHRVAREVMGRPYSALSFVREDQLKLRLPVVHGNLAGVHAAKYFRPVAPEIMVSLKPASPRYSAVAQKPLCELPRG